MWMIFLAIWFILTQRTGTATWPQRQGNLLYEDNVIIPGIPFCTVAVRSSCFQVQPCHLTFLCASNLPLYCGLCIHCLFFMNIISIDYILRFVSTSNDIIGLYIWKCPSAEISKNISVYLERYGAPTILGLGRMTPVQVGQRWQKRAGPRGNTNVNTWPRNICNLSAWASIGHFTTVRSPPLLCSGLSTLVPYLEPYSSQVAWNTD